MNKLPFVEKYVTILNEFFYMLNQPGIINQFDNVTSVVYTGLNAINGVFEFVLLKTKNLEKTTYYSQKAYFYYLEYMKQIIQSNLSNSLNHTDAKLFVYKKTIYDLYDGENNQSFNTMSNIMTLTSSTIEVNNKELSNILFKMFRLTNVLFDWDNQNICFTDRVMISQVYLNRCLTNIDCIDTISTHLDMIHQKLQINIETYKQLLTAILEKTDKKNTPNDNEHYLTKFIIDESIFISKFEDGNMKEFVQWLYSDK
jgi:hypothetical protein